MTDVVTEPLAGTRRRRWRLFVLAGILIVLVAYLGLDVWAGYRVNVAAARFDVRYGGLSDRHLTTAVVPAANNRARLIRAASALTVSMSTPATAAFTNLSRAPEMKPLSQELRAFVQANEPALNMIADAGARTESSWETEYADPSNAPPWMDIRALWQAVYVAALLKIEDGQPDEAAKRIASGLAMAASLRQEPNLIAQLYRIAIADRQFDAIQRLITRTEPSKTALEEVAGRLAENRAPDPVRVGLLGEVRLVHAALKRTGQGGFEDGLFGRGPSPWKGPLARVGRPFVRLAHASYLRDLEQLLDLQAGPRPRPQFKEPSRLPLVGRLTGRLTAGLERAIATGDDFLSELGAAEVAVALRRYRLDRGAYPDELAALVPAYLAELPVNPFTAKPPVYARQSTGFTLTAPRSEIHTRAVPPTPEWTVNR
jgi:hypothetical protein